MSRRCECHRNQPLWLGWTKWWWLGWNEWWWLGWNEWWWLGWNEWWLRECRAPRGPAVVLGLGRVVVSWLG
ncbi:hypothetical protein [Actinoplanes regularis]|uniref:hypothetical protein n=1 Tax=Actinoplanes regularis TaxID=52697 RepID=UPI0015C5C398|nr:hypothetical protein [Actinoplanes regularis]